MFKTIVDYLVSNYNVMVFGEQCVFSKQIRADSYANEAKKKGASQHICTISAASLLFCKSSL